MSNIRLFALAVLLLIPGLSFANQAASGFCTTGGIKVTTFGSLSSNPVQGSYLGCSVTVNIHGGGLATITDASGGALANPFTASSTNGFWQFAAANGFYDVTLSGGNPALPAPVTIVNLLLNDPNTASITQSSFTGSGFISSTALVAGSGIFRCASVDNCLVFRNIANGLDLALKKTGAAAGNLPADVLDASAFGGIKVSQFFSNSAQSAATGVLACSASDTCVSFRNQANSADIPGLAHDASDRIVIGGAAGFTASIGNITNGLTIGTTLTVGGASSLQGVTATTITASGEIAPSITGGALGDTAHRFDAFIRNLDVITLIIGSMTVSGNITAGSGTFTGNVSVGGTATHTGPASFAKGFLGPDPWADVTANGLVGDGSTDNTAAFNTLIASACSSGTKYLWFPSPGNFVFKSKPNAIHCGLYLVGPISLGANYSFGSFITMTYNAGTNSEPFLSWDGANATTQGNGGGVWGVNILVNPANTAGALINANTAGGCTNRAGDMIFYGFKLGGGGGGLMGYGFDGDGTGCTGAGTQGLRDFHIDDVLIFGATQKALRCQNCVHFYWGNGATSPGGGVGDAQFTGLGAGTAASTDIVLSGISIFGNLQLDQVTQFAFLGIVTGTLSCTANTTNSTLMGDISTISGCINQASYFTAQSGASLFGVNGTLNLGRDLCIGINLDGGATTCFRRNNGSGTGTNLAISMDAFSTIPFNFDTTNGFTTTRPISSTVATGTAPIVVASTTNVAKLNASILTGSGTAAALTGTGACATLSTQTGGAIAGQATCTGTTGASTITITPGLTAPHGWVCHIQDQTTRANLLQQTSNGTASCTLTATSVTQNDVFVFSAIDF